VLLRKNPVAAVQQEPVQAVFKSVRVDETGKQTENKTIPGRSNKPHCDECERQTGQSCRDQIISLDPQPQRSIFSPNVAV
jgi:hypothetical protein